MSGDADDWSDDDARVERGEIIAVGTELLLGEIVDTNSAWLAEQLAEHSVDVFWSLRVGDNLSRLQRALDAALRRSDLVVLCGGLGPTDDDLTREAIAAALGEEPALDPELERDLRARFASFSRRMPERNLKQAWLIPSARPLPNPVGTAPGWLARTARDGRRRTIVALPGPPREMMRMWRDEVVPRLRFPSATFVATTLKTHGLGESTVAERLGELTRAGNPSVATYAKRDGVHVRVAAKAETLEEAHDRLAPVLERVETTLADHVWGRDGDELPDRVLEALRARRLRLALVESGSGGRLADLLTAADAGSATLTGAVIAWAPDAFAAPTLESGPSSAGRAPSIDESEALASAALRRAHGLGAEVVLFTGPFRHDAPGAEASASAPQGVETTIGFAPTPEASTSGAAGPPIERTVRTLRLPPHGEDWLRDRVTFTTLYQLWRALQPPTP